MEKRWKIKKVGLLQTSLRWKPRKQHLFRISGASHSEYSVVAKSLWCGWCVCVLPYVSFKTRVLVLNKYLTISLLSLKLHFSGHKLYMLFLFHLASLTLKKYLDISGNGDILSVWYFSWWDQSILIFVFQQQGYSQHPVSLAEHKD